MDAEMFVTIWCGEELSGGEWACSCAVLFYLPWWWAISTWIRGSVVEWIQLFGMKKGNSKSSKVELDQG